MSWQEEYKSKLASAEEAVRIVESGDRVVIPIGSQPRALADALAARGGELNGVGIVLPSPEIDPQQFVTAGPGAFQVELEIMISPAALPTHEAGQAPFLPLPFSLSFKAVDQRPSEAKPIDVVMVQVTPPDSRGLVSFGPHVFFKRGYARRARKLLAEVNPALIRTHGDCFLPVSSFDRLVEVQPPTTTREELLQAISSLPEERRVELTEIIGLVNPARLAPIVSRLGSVDPRRIRRNFGLDEPAAEARAIADTVRRLIPDGATIQIGVGTPGSYLPRLGVFDDKVDLGLHSEMVAPGIARLVDSGVINGSRKTIHRGKAVAASWSGSDDQDLAIIDDNPLFELHEAEYVLNPALIAQNRQQISMNNALSVDLLGQINAESVFGGRMYGGLGGQPETHLGALYSEGGRAITLLQSTAVEGSVSRIVPRLEEGEMVTIPRFFADTVVTEYGMANLVGRNHRERAEALIGIAHPDFRAELRKAAKGWLL